MALERVRKRKIELPELPEPCKFGSFSHNQMEEYAKAAVDIDRRAIFSRAKPMEEGSLYHRIMEALRTEGPMTTTEVGIAFPEVNSTEVSVYLRNLFKRGHVTREKFRGQTLRGVRDTYLWRAVSEAP